MLDERLRNLNELLINSRNEKPFPEKNPTLKRAVNYWEFNDDKQLRDFRTNQYCRKQQLNDEEEEEEENDLAEINIYNEDSELIDKEEILIKDEEKEKEQEKKEKKKKTGSIIRIYEKKC
jgi:hypothetical protein